MTRLKTEWIEDISGRMSLYNETLKQRTGVDLSGLMSISFELREDTLYNEKMHRKVCVVPITQGEGLIDKFSESVANVINSMGFEAFVTKNTDVDGVYEATLKGADIIFMADDIRYMALNIKNGKKGENDYCTALGYVDVLFQMAKYRNRKIGKGDILILGYGNLGKHAEKILLERKFKPKVYDKLENVNQSIKMEEIKDYEYILDFTNEGGWLDIEKLNKDVLYASPGVPLSLNNKTVKKLKDKAVYDVLEIGTAIMLGSAI
ncbi:MAG TPA: 3-methylornithyl-N6-L-lysine dehydrogenase PylD [Anaerovoracaceae bacterium]|nr:3-methylornithyl-N6-L-lysine dehydrogenase PylD [Anaerovoracaceae bacterium]